MFGSLYSVLFYVSNTEENTDKLRRLHRDQSIKMCVWGIENHHDIVVFLQKEETSCDALEKYVTSSLCDKEYVAETSVEDGMFYIGTMTNKRVYYYRHHKTVYCRQKC